MSTEWMECYQLMHEGLIYASVFKDHHLIGVDYKGEDINTSLEKNARYEGSNLQTDPHCLYLQKSHYCCLVAQLCLTFVTPWTTAHQAPLSMEFSRQECWSREPFPSPEDLPDPRIKPRSPALQVDSLLSEPPGKSPLESNYHPLNFFFKKRILVKLTDLLIKKIMPSEDD